MKSQILSQLNKIEDEENIWIVYACESGSRAWGFPSADSDYDVRFLYVRPVEWYLSIDAKRDVIEKPLQDELDISGWDLKKALLLFRKSNPPLLEWLGSPIVYREQYSVAESMRELLPDYYSPTAETTCLHRRRRPLFWKRSLYRRRGFAGGSARTSLSTAMNAGASGWVSARRNN